MTFNVLIEETVNKDNVTVVLREPDYIVAKTTEMDEATREQFRAGAQALIVRSEQVLKADLLKSPNLRVIGRAGSGTDNIETDMIKRINAERPEHEKIIVMNVPNGNSDSVAELTIGHLINLARGLPAANAAMHADMFPKKEFSQGMELKGKTLGLKGFGRIGRKVAAIAQAMGMKVIADDPELAPDTIKKLKVEKVSFEDLLARADVISLHIPKSTNHILGREEIAKCKPGVFIINCARGGLIDEQALLEALLSGHVRGAALDVLEKEPKKGVRNKVESPLIGNDKVLLSPHIGASTVEAQRRVVQETAWQIKDLFELGIVRNAVNVKGSLTVDDAEMLAPYIELGGQLAGFARQVKKGDLNRVGIVFEGGVTIDRTEPLANIMLTELLRDDYPDANMLNVGDLAKNDKIQIETLNSKREPEDHALMRIELEMQACKLEISGYNADGKPRLLKVNDVILDSSLRPYMLCVRNANVPGVFGAVTTLIGNAKINMDSLIGKSTVDRTENIILLSTETKIEEKLLMQIKAVNGVKDAWVLEFPSGKYTLQRPSLAPTVTTKAPTP